MNRKPLSEWVDHLTPAAMASTDSRGSDSRNRPVAFDRPKYCVILRLRYASLLLGFEQRFESVNHWASSISLLVIGASLPDNR